MKVYVSHEYGGKQENAEAVEKMIVDFIIKEGSQYKNDIVFLSPIHALGFAYNHVKYEIGLDWCLQLLEDCDIMVYFPGKDQSMGVITEKKHAWILGIPTIDWATFTDSLPLITSTMKRSQRK